MGNAMDALTRAEQDEVERERLREHFNPKCCDVCGAPTRGDELLLPGESGSRIAHQLCYWRQRALAAEGRPR